MEPSIIPQQTQADSLQNVQLQAGQVISPKALADGIVAQALAQPTAEEQKREERLIVLEATRVTTQTEVEPEQYALIAIYESIQDLVQEPSPADWEAWMLMGMRAAARLSELRGLWQDTNYHACTNPNI